MTLQDWGLNCGQRSQSRGGSELRPHCWGHGQLRWTKHKVGCLYTFPPVCIRLSQFDCVYVNVLLLSVSLSISVFLSVYLYTGLSVVLPVWLYFCWFCLPSVYLSVFLPTCLSIYIMSVCPLFPRGLLAHTPLGYTPTLLFITKTNHLHCSSFSSHHFFIPLFHSATSGNENYSVFSSPN